MKNINKLLKLYHNILLSQYTNYEDIDLTYFLECLSSELSSECAIIYKFDEDYKGEIIKEYRNGDYSVMKNVSTLNIKSSDESLTHRQYRVDDDHLMLNQGDSFRDRYYTAIVRDVDKDPLTDCYRSYLKSIGCGSYLIGGLFKNYELWGLIGIYNTSPSDWKDSDIALVTVYSFMLSSILTYKETEDCLQTKLQEAESFILDLKTSLNNKEIEVYKCEERIKIINNLDPNPDNIDKITGLNTKNELDLGLRFIKSIMPTQQKSAYYALLIECSRYSLFKEYLGDACTNQIIKQMAARLANFRGGGITKTLIYKYEDNKFLLIIGVEVNTDPNEILEMLQERLKEPYDIKRHAVYFPCVIGMTDISLPKSKDKLIRELDLSLYCANKNNKPQHYFYDKDNSISYEEILIQENILRKVLHNNNLVPYFQLVVDVNSKKVVFLECLLRYVDDNGNICSPYSLVTYAEKVGLIYDLENLFVPKALRNFSWLKQKFNLDCKLAINTSPAKFLSKDIVKYYKDLIRSAGLNPEDIILEITESAEVPLTILKQMIKDLKDAGFLVAVDDFGTGYCSLTYVLDIPFDIVKLDDSFTQAIQQKHNKHILKAVISACSATGKKVVAEGIETPEMKEELSELGVNIMQGYLFHKPCSIHDFTKATFSF